MKIIFELSGEHENLPKAEVLACLEAEDVTFSVSEEDRGILAVDTQQDGLEALGNRLALCHYVDEMLFSCECQKLSQIQEPLEIGQGSFAVRGRRLHRSHEDIDLKKLEKMVADRISGGNNVDLEDPDIEVRLIVTGRCFIGRRLKKIDRSSFERRKVRTRPFFSPISLHPRLARALVNLSRVRKGQILLDPFCGTGGVLMEASLIGAKSVGSDIDERMVQGCRDNLDSIGIEAHKLFCSDISGIGDVIGAVDAVATDPPYGRSATTNREDISSLYHRAFKALEDILKSGGHLSIVLPDEELIKLGGSYLTLNEVHAMRVHRSLTRNFCVYKKE